MISGKVEGIGEKGKGCQRHMLRWAGLPSQRTDLKNLLFKKHVALKKKKKRNMLLYRKHRLSNRGTPTYVLS